MPPSLPFPPQPTTKEGKGGEEEEQGVAIAEVEVGEGERYLTSNVEGGRTGTTTGAGLAADDRGNSRLREIKIQLKNNMPQYMINAG